MGKGTLLQIHLHEGDRKGLLGRLVYEDIVHDLWKSGAPGITVFRGEEGLDAHRHIQNIHSEYMSDNLPVDLDVYGTQREIEDIIVHLDKQLQTTNGEAFCFAEVVDVKDGDWRDEAVREDDAALRIYMKENDEYNGQPLYHALVVSLRDIGISWVTVTRALEGFGAEHVVHKAKLFRLSEHAPVSVEAVLSSSKIQEVIDKLQPLIQSASGPAILLQGRMVSRDK
ncbi:DUF190 domain-containing protein [Alicyclobacillus cycloheptanicus]|uniref:PII-like signaling protein n=1 Tax=Alicyclobacillus cycloheptanicus TaxID=1457 RepID=A0ABT9XJJ1_9BACL|nr:DUF190 domain-containing protein [Alicyclobacillus cycloheptanicus]MDQ0190455.1 PII-like signaling protein [Alicyclobacillus cycloheptanicus]WDM02694.1 DUF190 domain-containing protein [Alicyclobacillus cycloheptanicus]